MYEQFIKEFGFSENFLDIVRKQKEILNLKINKIVTEDKSIQTFIDVCDFELEGLRKMGEGGNFMELKTHIEKTIGIKINPMECTVTEFYGYVKYIEKESKRTSNGR